jgi:hypothetical protein
MGCFSTDGPCLQKESLYEVVLTTSRSLICYAEDDGLGEELGSEAFCPLSCWFHSIPEIVWSDAAVFGMCFRSRGRDSQDLTVVEQDAHLVLQTLCKVLLQVKMKGCIYFDLIPYVTHLFRFFSSNPILIQ